MATLTTTPIKTFVSGETVTPTKLNELSQSAVALTAGTIVAGDIAADAVTTVKILDANVTTAKIADANVTAAKLNGVAKDGSGVDIAVGAAPIFGCRAWVRFDGQRDTSGVVSAANTNRLIIASGNVTSVQRAAIGDYVVTFTTAMPTANYAAVVSARHHVDATFAVNADTNIVSSSVVQITTGSSAVGGGYNPISVNLSVFA